MSNQSMLTNKQVKVYKKDIARINGLNGQKKMDKGIIDKENAEELIMEYLSEQEKNDLNDEANTQKRREMVKDKQYLRTMKKRKRSQIVNCLTKLAIEVRGYNAETIDLFIDEMVAETAGYSVLEDAFNDPEVSDIYCIAWNKIFVEKNGQNVEYWRKFRSPSHYKLVIERFMTEAGKELNIGDSKIVNFELFGDRGCATSESVSPEARSMTIRKHKEEHITYDEIEEQGVYTSEMGEFLQMIIDGECNLIYGGLTGSGKTTTIRALIDHVVTKNGKRMLVCEDTQELFPKNEHTLQLVSCPTNNPETSIDLIDLIYAALRLKPKYIIVGEVRGMEAVAAVEAMETGHSTIFTMHGGTPYNILNRLNSKYLMGMPSIGSAVADRIIGASVDYIAIQSNIPGVGRVISSLVEISFDFNEGRMMVREIFVFDPLECEHVLKNRITKEKTSKMLERGVPRELLLKWTDSGDPEYEKEFIKNFNENYLKEKPMRAEMFKKRREEREAAKLAYYREQAKNMDTENLTAEALEFMKKQDEYEELAKNLEKMKEQN